MANLSAEQSERIVREETDKFLDAQFGSIDLSGCPSVQQAPTEKFEVADRHGFNRVDVSGSGAGSAALKQGIADLASQKSVLAELDKNDPAVAQAILAAQETSAEDESRRFLRAHPEYLRGDDNVEALTSVLAFNFLGWSEQEIESRDLDEARDELIARGYWTAEHLETAWDALRTHGHATLRPGRIRNLSDEELLEVARMGQDGMNRKDEGAVLRAVFTYVSYATGLDDDDIADDANALTLRPVLDRAAVYVFEQSTPSYTPTPQRRAFIRNYIAGRPITFPLLFSAWEACQKAEQRGFTSSLVGQDKTVAPPQNLDDLSDGELDELYHGTLRQVAVDSRRRI